MLPCHLIDPIHIGNASADVDWNHGLCLWRDFTLKIVWIQTERIAENIRENGDRSDRDHSASCGNETIGRHNHLIAFDNSQRSQTHFNRGGTIRTSHSEISALKCRKFRLELPDAVTEPPFTRP
jgi:hypothetical protein